MNTQIIAIANQKGGVGKTTTCANLGIGLAQAGKKVLLIDGDPQGSLTISLGNPQPDKLPFTLSDAMGKILMDHPIRPGEGILHHAEGVDLMPADIQLSGMEVSLVNAMSRETILRQYLDTLKGQYSHILIDCQPSLGMLTVNALAAANRIIIPVQAEYLPAKGLEQLLSTVSKVKRQINPKLQIDGILLTMVDNRTNFAKEMRRCDNHGKAQAGCAGFVLGVRRRTGTDPSKDAAIRDREFERLSAENGAGWLYGQAGTAGAEGVGFPDAPKQQQLEPADPQSA